MPIFASRFDRAVLATSDPGASKQSDHLRDCLLAFTVAILCLAVLRQLPMLDVSLSDLFFLEAACPEPATGHSRCGIFPMLHDPFWQIVRNIGYRLPHLMAFGVIAWLIGQIFLNRRKTARDLAVPVHALLSLALGPALIANFLTKELLTRPRPYQTSEFGGFYPFVPPGDISHFCQTNCSFVSGEAAAAFWMIWITPYLSERWRIPAFSLLVMAGAAIGVLRIAFGRHYLSDVIMSIFVALIGILISRYILGTPAARNILERWCSLSNRIISKIVATAGTAKMAFFGAGRE